MRIDKYLKVSRLIKRRTVAREACMNDRVFINGKVAKPGNTVKEGDIIEIRFGGGEIKVRVIDTPDHISKDMAQNIYEIIS
ncbi:MAG: RNA-binding S4 domain-containing protein [Clostridiales bacterium]|jgi:ribosomal 50S subunit-recycling heat shock protein|nr:RNA-binding S4 domain-containing protein [Clostridiales bacterium]